MTHTRRTRGGFTIVELLVAAAMCIMGMWLLTWLYQQGLESFRQARAQAELTGQQRMVTTLLTRDLQNPHFADEDTKPNRGRRLSDQRTDLVLTGGWTPPRGGYFRAGSLPVGNGTLPNPNNIFENVDPDGFDSSRSTDHFLQMTVLLPGGADYQTFSAEVPVGSGQQWFGTSAEVIYYLKQSGFTPGGIPLYDLYRQQRLVAKTTDDAPAYATPASSPDSPEVMVVSPLGTMRTLSDLTIPFGKVSSTGQGSVRLPGPAFMPLGSTGPSPRFGEDKLMSNVLSFEVKFTGPTAVLGAGAWPSDPTSTQWPRPIVSPTGGLPNSDYPYDNLPFDGKFDTSSTLITNWQTDVATVANPTGTIKPIRITGAQIRLRTYEPRTRSTRQTTLIVDL